jgi:Flp pilus assembly protein TadG
MIIKSRPDSGQAIVEFAFVLPFILILILGIIDFGALFYNKAMITNASREGARAGIVYQDANHDDVYEPHADSEIEAAVDSYLNGKLINFDGATAWVTDVPTNEATSPGGRVRVVVTYTHTFLAFGRLVGWGNTIDIGSETIMRVE